VFDLILAGMPSQFGGCKVVSITVQLDGASFSVICPELHTTTVSITM
jgi:hypothetical protein